MFFKALLLLTICFFIRDSYGEIHPDMEIETLKPGNSGINQESRELKTNLNKISNELKDLIDIVEKAKKTPADGPNSEVTVKKILAIPKRIEELIRQLESTRNALEKKELLA